MLIQDFKKMKRLITRMIPRIPDEQLIQIEKELVSLKDSIDIETARRLYNDTHSGGVA